MAEKSDVDRPLLYEPSPRSYCIVEGQLYVWGGDTGDPSSDDLQSSVCSYEPLTEQWSLFLTNGSPPSGLREGASTYQDHHLYIYGGTRGGLPYSGSLHSLNIDSHSWKQLSANSTQGPRKKSSCGMVAYANLLIVFGGYCESGLIQPGASYEDGYTNELHTFDLKEGKWSSPTVTGTRPPPCSYFSFTKNEHCAVLFGGSQPGGVRSSDVYILDLERMHWSKLDHSKEEPWPVGRSRHAATILNYGQDLPQLLVAGGYDKYYYLSDMWTLDLQSGKWNEISLPEKYQKERFAHCAAAINLTPDLTEVVLLGGSNGRNKLSATTVMRFERSGVDWILKDCCDYSTGLGSKQRLEMKRELKRQYGYLSAYNKILSSGESLDMLFGKISFVGLPSLGKTTMRRRLTGEIVDILSSGEGAQPSTGVAESTQIIIRELSTSTISITQGKWSSRIDLSEEARMFLKFCHEASTEKTRTIANPSFTTSAEVSPSHALTHPSPAPKQVSTPVKTVAFSSPAEVSTIDHVTQRAKVETATATSKNVNLDKSYIKEINDMLMKAMRSAVDWEQIKYSLEHTALIKMEDTGGQPEFMDMLPALVMSPSLCLIFCNLLHKLKSHYMVSYRSPSGEQTPAVQSSCTVEEVILQALSAVACFSSTSESIAAINKFSKSIIESSSSVAYIVGTHKDCVSEEQVSEFDRELQQIIKGTTFYRDGLVKFASENCLVLAVDNKSGGAEEVESIRKFLENSFQRHFKKISIPVAWLILSLFLRKSESRLVSLQTCEDIGQVLGMSPQETKVALWFLHHRAGVLMYFPEIPELKDTIICDIQVIYDSVNNMIIRTFKFGDVNKFAQEMFRETGQFSLEDIEKALKGFDEMGCYLTLEQLVKLLEYLNILALIAHSHSSVTFPVVSSCQSPKSTYLMPCVLHNATSVELEEFRKRVSLNPHNPVPLMIRFECGFVPIGMFPATIANLISHSSLQLVTEGIRKNYVSFQFGSDYDIVTFTLLPRYYTISIDRELKEEATTPVHEVCDEVRRIVETSLNEVTAHLNYTFSMSFQFSFECPLHPGGDHLCVLKRCQEATPQVMLCLDNMKKPRPVKINSKQLVWFGKEVSCNREESGKDNHLVPLKDDVDISAYMSLLPPPLHPHLEQLLDWDHEGVDKDLSEIADQMLDWEEKLATHLELTVIDISDIRDANPLKPSLQRREALQMWKNKSGLDATYGHLLKLFVVAGHTDCVKATCEVLKRRCHENKKDDVDTRCDDLATPSQASNVEQSTSTNAAGPPCEDQKQHFCAGVRHGTLFKELFPLANEWENIGSMLDISLEDLDDIKRSNSQHRDCLREMIKVWLKMTDPVPTWENLVEAVDIIDPKRAEKIKSMYIMKT